MAQGAQLVRDGSGYGLRLFTSEGCGGCRDFRARHLEAMLNSVASKFPKLSYKEYHIQDMNKEAFHKAGAPMQVVNTVQRIPSLMFVSENNWNDMLKDEKVMPQIVRWEPTDTDPASDITKWVEKNLTIAEAVRTSQLPMIQKSAYQLPQNQLKQETGPVGLSFQRSPVAPRNTLMFQTEASVRQNEALRGAH